MPKLRNTLLTNLGQVSISTRRYLTLSDAFLLIQSAFPHMSENRAELRGTDGDPRGRVTYIFIEEFFDEGF